MSHFYVWSTTIKILHVNLLIKSSVWHKGGGVGRKCAGKGRTCLTAQAPLLSDSSSPRYIVTRTARLVKRVCDVVQYVRTQYVNTVGELIYAGKMPSCAVEINVRAILVGDNCWNCAILECFPNRIGSVIECGSKDVFLFCFRMCWVREKWIIFALCGRIKFTSRTAATNNNGFI